MIGSRLVIDYGLGLFPGLLTRLRLKGRQLCLAMGILRRDYKLTYRVNNPTFL